MQSLTVTNTLSPIDVCVSVKTASIFAELLTGLIIIPKCVQLMDVSCESHMLTKRERNSKLFIFFFSFKSITQLNLSSKKCYTVVCSNIER